MSSFHKSTQGTVGVKDHAVVGIAAVLAVASLCLAYRSASDRKELERLREQHRLVNKELARLEESFANIKNWTRNADNLASASVVPVQKTGGRRDPLNLSFASEESVTGGLVGHLALAARPLNRVRERGRESRSDLESFRVTITKIDGLRQDTDTVGRRLRNLSALLQTDKGLLRRIPTMRPVAGRITSSFGWRLSPFEGKRALHTGVDIAAPPGTEVVAPADGQITFAGKFDTLGRAVVIHHGSGYETRYGHLSQILVAEGASVKRGDVIARVGNTGRSTGPHLHYEVWARGQAVDPSDFLYDQMGGPDDGLTLATRDRKTDADPLTGVGGDEH